LTEASVPAPTPLLLQLFVAAHNLHAFVAADVDEAECGDHCLATATIVVVAAAYDACKAHLKDDMRPRRIAIVLC
jgi:hypothetical protein